MSRYIDADAMKEWIDEYVSVFKKSDNKDIKGYIEHQPTIEAVPKDFHDKTCEAMAKAHQEEIADMVSVVRCKDCKHWYPDADCGMACEFTNMSQPNDGYCNWGVPKQTEREGE